MKDVVRSIAKSKNEEHSLEKTALVVSVYYGWIGVAEHVKMMRGYEYLHAAP